MREGGSEEGKEGAEGGKEGAEGGKEGREIDLYVNRAMELSAAWIRDVYDM